MSSAFSLTLESKGEISLCNVKFGYNGVPFIAAELQIVKECGCCVCVCVCGFFQPRTYFLHCFAIRRQATNGKITCEGVCRLCSLCTLNVETE